MRQKSAIVNIWTHKFCMKICYEWKIHMRATNGTYESSLLRDRAFTSIVLCLFVVRGINVILLSIKKFDIYRIYIGIYLYIRYISGCSESNFVSLLTEALSLTRQLHSKSYCHYIFRQLTFQYLFVKNFV